MKAPAWCVNAAVVCGEHILRDPVLYQARKPLHPGSFRPFREESVLGLRHLGLLPSLPWRLCGGAGWWLLWWCWLNGIAYELGADPHWPQHQLSQSLCRRRRPDGSPRGRRALGLHDLSRYIKTEGGHLDAFRSNMHTQTNESPAGSCT